MNVRCPECGDQHISRNESENERQCQNCGYMGDSAEFEPEIREWNITFYNDKFGDRDNEKTYTVHEQTEDEAIDAARDLAKEDFGYPYCSEVDGPYEAEVDG